MYKIRPSEKVIADDEEHCDYLFDSVEEYLADCESDEIEPNDVQKTNEIALQFPNADDIVEDIIENIGVRDSDVIPEDWDYRDIENYFIGLNEFKKELDVLIKKFNDKQRYNIFNGTDEFIKVEDMKNV